jgi:Dolichyl-phosphate-mannose-protein mannosyltransferase
VPGNTNPEIFYQQMDALSVLSLRITPRKWVIAFLGLIGLMGSLLLWYSTPLGIGVGYDSVYYLGSANSLLQGFGLGRFDAFGNFIPLTHFPSLYSLTLAAGGFLLHGDTVLAGRLVATISFGCLIFLVGWLVYTYSGSPLPSFLTAGIILFSSILLDVHLEAMSEPLFLLLMLTSLYLVERYLAREKMWVLVVAGLVAGFSFLTRYIGISVVAAGVLAVLFLSKKPGGRRLLYGVIFGLIGVIPVAIWYLRNFLLTGILSNRTVLYHLPQKARLLQGIRTISNWILPVQTPLTISYGLILIASAVLIILLVLFFRSNSSIQEVVPAGSDKRFVTILLIFLGTYLVFLVFSLTFFDASTKLNDRILSPVYLVLLMLLLIIPWNLIVQKNSIFLVAAYGGLCVLFMLSNLHDTRNLISDMRLEGRKFTGLSWQTSEIIAALKQLPPKTIIYTNESLPVSFLLSHPANPIPELVDPVKMHGTQDYERKIADMEQTIHSSKAVLAIFKDSYTPNVYPPLDELTQGLMLWKEFNDGAIYIAEAK